MTSPELTGGKGFSYEDHVAAWFTTHLLRGLPFHNLGRVIRLDFQVESDGWRLDDLLVTCEQYNKKYRCAISIKSDSQFTAKRAPVDFVERCWQQYLHISSSIFKQDTDYLGIITGPMGESARKGMTSLLENADKQKPEDLARRIDNDKFSQAVRDLFYSFRCPSNIPDSSTCSDSDIGKLLKRVIVRPMDVSQSNSEDEKRAQDYLRDALVSGKSEDAYELWIVLLTITQEYGDQQGTLDLPILLRKLQGSFKLKDYPEYAHDWQRLRDSSKTRWQTIADTIGGSVRLPRTTNHDRIVNELQQYTAVCILGESGSGKSVLARRIAEAEQYAKTTVIWLDATLFDVPDLEPLSRISLGLEHNWQTLADSVAEKTVLVILDGLDRLYKEKSLANFAVFASTLRLEQAETPFRVLASCQPQRWDTIQRVLLQHIASGGAWKTSTLENPTWQELEPLVKKFPQLNVLLRREHLHSVLLRSKVLDLLACSLQTAPLPETRQWTGESDLIEWFWQTEIANKPQGVMRENVLCRLAEQQATQLTQEISQHAFAMADLTILDLLETERICYRKTGRIGFSHDLYADWSRQHLLLGESGNPQAFILPRLDSPVWHRAIMLFGLDLLERQEDIETWASLLTVSESLADLMLEALIYAADAETMLAKVWDVLQIPEGKWLRRLLQRFLYIATEPNPNIMRWAKETKYNEIEASTLYRWPRPPFWVPVIRFLSFHQSICIELAPAELAEITHTWLIVMPEKIICRQEAAQMALALAWKTLRHRQHHRWHDPWPPAKSKDFEKVVYRAALVAVHDTPDVVFEFALCACGCRPPTEPLPPIEIEPKTPPRPLSPKLEALLTAPSLLPDESIPISPWPDGPKWPVDSKFQDLFLEEINYVLPLIASNPKMVAELILALCIQHKNKRDYESDCGRMRNYDLTNSLHYWYPPFYDKGPFLLLLRVSPETGLEVIIKLVNIATHCWLDCQRWLQKYRPYLFEEESPLTIRIAHDEEHREWIGDRRWLFAYRDSTTAPDILVCALMALEQWFYEHLDKNEPVEEFIDGILGCTCSLALAGVLIAVAKRKLSLFTGSLKAFLGAPELYQFESHHFIKGERHQMMAWDCWQHTESQIEQVKAWHDMKHRQVRLENVAVRLMLTEPSLQSFFAD
jgi:hypothetical protein